MSATPSSSLAVSLADVLAAYGRIKPYVRNTQLDESPYLAQFATGDGPEEAVETRVYLKCENLQHTGSFKFRGALNKILATREEKEQPSSSHTDKKQTVITASSGNHGAALAYATHVIERSGELAKSKPGYKAVVYVPETAPAIKVANIERLGATIRKYGTDAIDTEIEARSFAERERLLFVSPYNDPLIVSGQGTIGVELLNALPGLDAVFVSVGGGGLISGIATYLKAAKPSVQIIACSPANSQVMADSVKAGKLLSDEDSPTLPTLSDGTAGGIESGAITFPICSKLVDRWISVTEDEIETSLIECMTVHHMVVEGAAAVAVAGFKKIASISSLAGRTSAILLCGANIDPSKLGKLLTRSEGA